MEPEKYRIYKDTHVMNSSRNSGEYIHKNTYIWTLFKSIIVFHNHSHTHTIIIIIFSKFDLYVM